MIKLDNSELNAGFWRKIPDECNVKDDLIYEIYKTSYKTQL